MLTARDLWYSYQHPVLKGVSFSLDNGQLVGLLGPNGSGKTTLLRIIRNRIRPDRGEILFEDKPVQSYSNKALAQKIGYVLQDHQFGFPLTVLEYVLQGRFAYAERFAFETAKDRDAAQWAMSVTCTKPYSHRRMNELSGGERQRVVLARALASQPKILLLDEPTANMDLAFQVEMMRLIKRITIEYGVLSILVTHELNLAAGFSDRVLLMRSGEVLADGNPADVITPHHISQAFGCHVQVDENPFSHAPRISFAVDSIQQERHGCSDQWHTASEKEEGKW
jgi:iron complex transport system ATP-binding protein